MSTDDHAGRERVPIRQLLSEPYRIFFPIGIIWGLVGVAFWVPKAFMPEWLEETSSKMHVWLQLYGFIWPFVVGFLTTALPFFMGVAGLRPWELMVLLAGVLVPAALVLPEEYRAAHSVFLAALLFLMGSMGVRFIRRGKALAATFIFMPFGLLSAAIGSALNITMLSGVMMPSRLAVLANNLLVEGFILFLILAVGGFLFPILTRPAGEDREGGGAAAPVGLDILLHGTAALMILLSFLIEAFGLPWIGMLARALIVTCEALGQMRIHRRHTASHAVAVWLRVAMWLLLVGLWVEIVCPPQYRLAVRHITLVGGFALSAFAVGTHAILSHGGYPSSGRGRSVTLAIVFGLMLLALLTRVSADFMPERAFKHYAYAAIVWCAGLLVWAATILPGARFRPVNGGGRG